MAAKKKAPAIPLAEVMRAIDVKDRGWYTKLDAEKKKAFSAWMMMRYASCVRGNMSADYLYMVNECVNNRFSDVSKHPELQWLLATTVSPGMGTFRHDWIKSKKREGGTSRAVKFLRQIYPTYSEDELELLAQINTTADLKQLAKDLGWDDKRIKSEL